MNITDDIRMSFIMQKIVDANEKLVKEMKDGSK